MIGARPVRAPKRYCACKPPAPWHIGIAPNGHSSTLASPTTAPDCVRWRSSGRREQLARQARGDDHRIGQGQRELRQYRDLEAAPDLRPARHDEMREARRNDSDALRRSLPLAQSSRRLPTRRARSALPGNAECASAGTAGQRREPDPRRLEHQLDAEHTHQEAEAELKPGADRLRDRARETPDPAGDARARAARRRCIMPAAATSPGRSPPVRMTADIAFIGCTGNGRP